MRKIALIALAAMIGLSSAASFAGDMNGAPAPAATMQKHHKKHRHPHRHHHRHHHNKVKKPAAY